MSDFAPAQWPKCDYETLSWPSIEHTDASKRARERHRGPYQSAIAPRIAELQFRLPSDISALIAEATAAVVRFDSEMGSEITRYSSLMLRSESASSSQIENLTASARSIGEAEIGLGGHNGLVIVANQRAMMAALAIKAIQSIGDITSMHRALMKPLRPAIAGIVRTQPVWIGGSIYGPHGAQFVPPRPELVIDALQDVVQFIKRSDIDPFTIAVLSHAQFETIHPFADGNGRTGRALVHAILHGSKLTSHSTLPISAGLLHDIDLYFAALMSYREGDIRPIMEAFVNATFHALTNSKALVEELRQIRSRWSDTLPVRNGSNTLRLLDVLVRIPVLNAQIVCEELEIGPNNVGRIVQPLVDANILLESTGRQRGQVWRSPDVLNALDAFAARAGRRN